MCVQLGCCYMRKKIAPKGAIHSNCAWNVSTNWSDKMSYQELRTLARVRIELRSRLMSRQYEGSKELLCCLKRAADRSPDHESGPLQSEYERWHVRFELLTH